MKHFFLIAFLLFATSNDASAAQQRLLYQGVNMPQAASAGQVLPGIYGRNYAYPSAADIGLFADWGVNVIRLSFMWERLQPALYLAFDKDELARIDAVVSTAAGKNVAILLDPHNFGSFRKQAIGSGSVSAAAFADFWARLAAHYKNSPNVIFGLMNEPFKQSPEEWSAIAQLAIEAIRKTGAKQLILVPGTRYSGAKTWLAKKRFGLSNAEALRGIKDPLHNYAFELHQYFDSDYSGTHPTCSSPTVGSKALARVTAWLKETGNKGFLGEFGASKDPMCVEALRNTLAAMAENADVWIGWTYWASTAWFGNYMFNVYPPDATLFPQAAVLEEFLSKPQGP